MKPLLLLLVIILPCKLLVAQRDTFPIGLDERIFKKVINQQFSNLVTGQSKNSIGNFASLETKAPEISFAGSAISEKGSVITVKASGGYSDPFFKIFSNSALNTKISLDFQYHLLNLSSQKLIYYNESYRDYIKKYEEIINSYGLKLIAADAEQGKTLLSRKHHFLMLKLGDLRTKEAAEADGPVKDSLRYEISAAVFKLDSIDYAIETYPRSRTARVRLTNARNIELEELKTDIKVYGFRFSWLTVGYKVQNDVFRLFDSKQAMTDQIMKRSFASSEVRIQYSQYNWTTQRNRTYFVLAGCGFTYGHNLSDLVTKELTDITNYTSTPSQRTTTDKYSVYIGNYEKRLKGLRLYGDYYKFLFKNNGFAFHAYPEVKIRDKFRPAYNFGIGTLFSFKDEKDETATVNAEVYYNFLDLFDYLNTDDKFFERNDMGLRFSFPIKFKNK